MKFGNWLRIAIALILIGIGGLLYQQLNGDGIQFGNIKPEFDHTWTLQASELKELAIESDYAIDVQFIESTDGSNYVHIKGNMEQDAIDKLQNAEVKGGIMRLDITNNNSFRLFDINIPQSLTLNITVALSDSSGIDNLTVKVSSGNSEFRNIRSHSFQLTSTSGNVKFISTEVEDLKVSVTSGIITGEGVTAANLDISSVSGNITLDQLRGDGKIEAASGNITLSNQRSDNLDISVKSGNVRLTADSEFQGFYDLRTSSGKVTDPHSPQITKDIIKIRAGSGNITIKN